MTRIRFVSADGHTVREVDAPPGETLLDIAQADGQPLEGTCEGQMACSTCHVIVASEDFARLPPASEEEEDLLDLAAHVTRNFAEAGLSRSAPMPFHSSSPRKRGSSRAYEPAQRLRWIPACARMTRSQGSAPALAEALARGARNR